jgi:hypothetical protein
VGYAHLVHPYHVTALLHQAVYLHLFYACWIVLHLNLKHVVIDELEQQEGSILYKV